MPHSTALIKNGASKRRMYADEAILITQLRFGVRIVYKRPAAFLAVKSTCSFF